MIGKFIVLACCLAIFGISSPCTTLIVGNRRPVDLNDTSALADLKNLAQFAVNRISTERLKTMPKRSNLQLLRIVQAYTQVVAGRNVFLKLRLKDSYCKTDCPIELCDIEVYERAWDRQEPIKLTNYKCEIHKPRSLSVLGAFKTVSVDEERVKQVINYLVSE